MSDFEPIEWTGAPKLEACRREATVLTVESRKEGQPLTSKKIDETLADADNPNGRPARMLKITFQLETGGRVTDYVMLEGKGGFGGQKKLKALGIEKGQKFAPADLEGRRVVLDLKPEEYNGEESLKPKGYIAIAGGDLPKVNPNEEAPW